MEKEIQEMIRNLLKEKNMTERELALSIGTSQSQLNKLKNGNLNMRTFNTIAKLIAMNVEEKGPVPGTNITIECKISFK